MKISSTMKIVDSNDKLVFTVTFEENILDEHVQLAIDMIKEFVRKSLVNVK